MRKPIAFLHVQDKSTIYNISLYGKYTVITGFSGIGKSHLITAMLAIFALDASEGRENFKSAILSSVNADVITNSFRPIDSFTVEGWLKSFSSKYVSGSIICVDEDFRYLHTLSFQAAMVKFNALFVIICRDKLQYIPYGVQDIFELHLSQDGINHYNQHIYDYRESRSLDFSNYEELCTEDSKSGYEFFKSFLNNVTTSNGKTNIPRMIQECQNVVFCVDGYGFGKEFLDTMDLLKKFEYNHNALWIIDSFESLILQSDWFKLLNISVKPSILTDNLEQATTELLRTILASHKIYYSKSKLPDCFVKDCCFKPYANAPKFKCGLFCPGDKLELILGKELLTKLLNAFGDARTTNVKIPALVGSGSQAKTPNIEENVKLEFEEVPDEDSEDRKDSSSDISTDLFTSVF